MAKPFKPEQFGRYLLTEKLATGGMAEIFNAKVFGAMGFEKSVVIKRILPQFAEDSEFLRMFITEAKLVCHLEHPNIVQVHELGEIDSQYYISMEYVNGIDARHLWRTLAKRKQRLPGLLALFIVSEFLKGLDYAHRAVGPDGQLLGVVHRDISPSNILISYRGDVKIGDFGIALVQQESKTQAGVLKGKFGYMSPEQVAGMKVDHRSDIFAAGIVLSELLLGRRLFLGQSDFETLDKVLNVRLDVLDEHESALPPEVVKIVRRALKREVGERYQSAQEFCDAIVEFLYDRRARIANETLAAFIAEHVAPYLVRSTGRGDVSSPSMSADSGSRSRRSPMVPSGIMPVVSDVGSRPPQLDQAPSPAAPVILEDDGDLDLPAPSRPLSRRASEEMRAALRREDSVPLHAPSTYGGAGQRGPLQLPIIEEPYPGSGPLDSSRTDEMSESDELLAPLHSRAGRLGAATAESLEVDLGYLGPPGVELPAGRPADGLPGPGSGHHQVAVAPADPQPDAAENPLDSLGLDDGGAFGAIPVFEMEGDDLALSLESEAPLQTPLTAEVEGAGEELDLGSFDQEEEELFIPTPSGLLPDSAGALVSGKLVSATSEVIQMEPDFAGKLSSRTVAKVLFRFSVVQETGLLVLSGPEAIGEQAELINWLRTIQERANAQSDRKAAGSRTCTIHLLKGEPHRVSADRSEEALVAYLIRTEILTAKKVEKAVYTNPHRKPVAALLAAGMLAPLQVSRHVTAFVLANCLDAFSWTDGDFAFYRDREAPSETFPSGLDSVAMMLRGVRNIDEVRLDAYLDQIAGRRIFVNRTPPARIERFDPDIMLQETYRALSGGRTVENLLEHLSQHGSLLEAKQSLYLLLECELAALG